MFGYSISVLSAAPLELRPDLNMITRLSEIQSMTAIRLPQGMPRICRTRYTAIRLQIGQGSRDGNRRAWTLP